MDFCSALVIMCCIYSSTSCDIASSGLTALLSLAKLSLFASLTAMDAAKGESIITRHVIRLLLMAIP